MMISTVEMLSGTIGRYQQKPGVVDKAYLNSPLFYTEPTFFAMTNDQHKMDSFLRPKQPKQQQQHMTIMKSLPHFSPMEHVQKDPVNLAVFHSRADDDNSDQKEIIDVVGMDNNSSSSSSSYSSLPASILRAPKASYPKQLTDSTAYHHFNFNNFATSEPYSPHLYSQLSNHSIMAQIDFRSYLNNSENFTTKQQHRQSLNVNDLIANVATSTSQNVKSSANEFSNYSNGVEFQQTSSSYLPTIKSEINTSQNYFKIPSAGKESTLKHRILSNSRSTQKLNGHNNNVVGSNHEDFSPLNENENELMNFIRGSLIELSNGTLRKVEELRTEDFVMSAEKSESLQIEDSTVVKIHQPSNNSNCVIITFSYENNKSKVDIETRVEHPFFVYGQGWKSFNPQESFKSLKLECQRLQVGDICLSLKPRKLNESLNLTTKSRNHRQQNSTKIYNEVKNSQEFKDGFEYDEYKKRRWSASEVYRDYENAFKKTKLTTT